MSDRIHDDLLLVTTRFERECVSALGCRVQKGKELNDFQRNPLDIEILSNLRFGSLEIRDTSVTRVTNNVSALGCRD
jgi:hypothetical protein